MKSDEIIQELYRFIDATRELEYSDSSASSTVFQHAIDLAEQIIDSLKSHQPISMDLLEKLNYCISDSLPWNDNILKSWNEIRRLQKLS